MQLECWVYKKCVRASYSNSVVSRFVTRRVTQPFCLLPKIRPLRRKTTNQNGKILFSIDFSCITAMLSTSFSRFLDKVL